MNRDEVVALLTELQQGKRSVEEAAERLATLPFEDLGFARIDHHRSLRSGLPEVVFGAGKASEQIAQILARIHATGAPALATRCNEDAYAATKVLVPSAVFHDTARCITCGAPRSPKRGQIAIVCAGTSDLPVAEEAAVTAELFGAKVSRFYDVGVAGLHRLLAHLSELRKADIVIVCAGMEGALPSVVGGLLAVPVIAVPTSVGYGASFQGVTALLGMLNSCAPNVTVVNIDNGFGAAYSASLHVSRLPSEAKE